MPEITRLLAQWSSGDARAQDALFRAVHGELRTLARAVLWREHTVSLLDPGGLVGEAWLRMSGRPGLAFESRGASSRTRRA